MKKLWPLTGAALVVFVAGCDTNTQSQARDLGITGPVLSRVGAVGSIHLEVPTLSSQLLGFDFEGPSYVQFTDPSADIRAGGVYPYARPTPCESPATCSILGYQELIALNGGGVANLGVVDFRSTQCRDARSATYSSSVSTLPYDGTVFLVQTGTGTFVKLLLTGIDATAPNGIFFDYEIFSVDCSLGPPDNPGPPLGQCPSGFVDILSGQPGFDASKDRNGNGRICQKNEALIDDNAGP